MLKRIKSINTKNYSSFNIDSDIKNVYFINKLNDYLNYLEISKNNFKVVGDLTNTIVNPISIFGLDIILCRSTLGNDIIISDNGEIIVDSSLSLKILCNYLIKKGYDCSYLIGIPGTVGGAVVNNSGSGRLNQSIYDNLIKVDFYFKDKHIIKNKKDIIFSYRNSEFKFKNNIYINKIYLKFNKLDKKLLKEKVDKRYSDRSITKEIYTNPSLGTFYIKNKRLKYYDITEGRIFLKNNKIISNGINITYDDFSYFLRKTNRLYEVEIEEVTSRYKYDYIGLLIQDKNGNILLQKRDENGINNKGKVSLFGGGVEDGEDIIMALQREIKEELNYEINDTIFIGLFLKKYDNLTVQRCFIFRKVIDDINIFSEKIKCNEGNIFINNLDYIDDIIKDELYTDILKKSLIYSLNFK